MTDIVSYMTNANAEISLDATRKNRRLHLNAYPKADGTYILRVYDQDLKRYLRDTHLVNISGSKITYILEGNDSSWGVAQENTACPITKTIMTTGVTDFQDALRDFLISQSKDVEKIFFKSFDSNLRTTVVDSSEDPEKDSDTTDDESTKTKKPRKRTYVTEKSPFGKAPPNLFAQEKSVNGMIDIRTYEDQFVVVKGHVQSGKTKFIMSSAIWYLSQGKHVVVVLRNASDDKNQLTGRFQIFSKTMRQYLAKCKVQAKFAVEMIDTKKARSCMFTTGLPKIFVCLGNNKALENFNELIEATPEIHKRFVTFIDEVDYVYSEDTKVKDQLELLRSHTYSTFAVSATVLDPLLKEKVQKNNLIFLEKPEGYVGLNNLHHRVIPEDSRYGTDTKDDIFECDPYFTTAMEEFATSELTRTEHFDSISQEWHPRYWLARITYTLDRLQQALSYMAITYPECVAMSYTGNGKIILALSSQTKPIILKNSERSSIQTIEYPGIGESSYHVFKNASPGLVIEWLHNNGGFDLYPRIIVFASKMAARSISFGAANYEECNKKGKLWWHLTSMYALLSSKQDQPEMLQCLGRLCVVKNDTIPLFLYSTDQVRKDLQNAYHLQEELVTRANARLSKSKIVDNTMSRIIQDVSIFREKVPKRDLIKKEADEEIKLKIVSDAALEQRLGGWDMKKRYVNVDENGKKLSVEYLEPLDAEEDGDVESDEEVEEEEEEEALGKYTIIDQSKLNPSTKMYKMISDVIALLIENGEYNKEVLARTITKRLLETKYTHLNGDGIYSILWSKIKQNKFDTTNKLPKSSLLFWKDNSTLKVMLTK
jgi:hypothetical protein